MEKTELYEIMDDLADILGYEDMANQLAMAMDVQELENNLRFIDRMNETNLFYDGAYISRVVSWTGRVLKEFTFEEHGEDCEFEAILYRERIAEEDAITDWNDNHTELKESYESVEDLIDAHLEDLYIESYNRKGEKIPVNFG